MRGEEESLIFWLDEPLQFYQMWGLIIEKDDIEESCRWFRKKGDCRSIYDKKLVQAMKMDTQVIQAYGKAVAEMQNFLRAKVV